MWWWELVASYLHYLGVFGLIACLVSELALYRPPLDEPRARLIGAVDYAYLFTAVFLAGAGFLRVWLSPKSGDFFWRNGFFYVKLSCATLIGALSVVPTMHYYRYWKALRAGAAPAIADAEARRIRAFIWAQIALACLMPLWGLLMVRGLWLF